MQPPRGRAQPLRSYDARSIPTSLDVEIVFISTWNGAGRTGQARLPISRMAVEIAPRFTPQLLGQAEPNQVRNNNARLAVSGLTNLRSLGDRFEGQRDPLAAADAHRNDTSLETVSTH